MSDSVVFSSFELIVDGKEPDADFLNAIFSEKDRTQEYEGYHHKIQCDVIESRFYWFYSNFGKALPYRDIVLDIPTGEELENPRTRQQVEPTDQLFAIYDSESSIFYISNINKKVFIQEFLKISEKGNVIIKNIYKDIEHFICDIKTLESIKFTGSRNMFNKDGDLFSSLRDIFGYGEPEEFSIEAKYRIPIKQALKDGIRRLVGYQNSGDIKTMVCIGKDDRGLESVFNANNFISKISIPLPKDNQQLFPPDAVKEQVVVKLKDIANV